MIPCELLEPDNQEFNILLDSETFDHELKKSNENARRIIRFSNSRHFQILRTPYKVADEDLNQIIAYELDFDERARNLRIYYSNDRHAIIGFWYSEKDIVQVACQLYGKAQVTEKELEAIRLAFIQATLSSGKTQNNLFITESKVLLKNRVWLETHYPGQKLNIVSVKEAIEILDLFLKSKQIYSAGLSCEYDEGGWYWYAFRGLIPHFHISSEWIKALSNRFVYLLMSLDKMGIEYYSGVSRNRQANLIYYFNYYISLVTGIMDSLALEAKDKYQLTFKDDRIPSRTSLHNKSGREFLKSLKQKNQPLRNHIRAHHQLINLIYELREVVIHREMYEQTPFRYNGKDGTNWEASFVKLEKSIWDIINHLSDSQGLDPFSKWGRYQDCNTYYLEPFTFCKEYLRRLIPFVDSFLEHLGYSDFITGLRVKNPKDSFLELADRMLSNSLIYYRL